MAPRSSAAAADPTADPPADPTADVPADPFDNVFGSPDLLGALVVRLPSIRDAVSLLVACAGLSSAPAAWSRLGAHVRATVGYRNKKGKKKKTRPGHLPSRAELIAEAKAEREPPPPTVSEQREDSTTLRALLRDAILPDELASRVWYHSFSAASYSESCHWRIAGGNEAVSNDNVISRVRFCAGGSMEWEAPGAGGYASQPGDEWKYVRRGLMETTAPGTCVQFRHVMPKAGYERLGKQAGEPVAYTLPAMRVYRVPRGWVLRSSHDTFTSFARGAESFDDDADPDGPPKFTWRLHGLRQRVDQADRRRDHSDDWLDYEQAHFVGDYGRLNGTKQKKSMHVYGDRMGNDFEA